MREAGVALLTVDWQSGEGALELGDLLESAPLAFRRDVLADWQAQIGVLLAQAQAQLYPEDREELVRRQRLHNGLRRELCEGLGGQRIELAEPLVNGDVLLHLQGGSRVVFYAHREDVKVEVVANAAEARSLAAADATGDYYLRESASRSEGPCAGEAPRRSDRDWLDA